MPRKDTREIRALLEDALTCEAQNPEQYAHLLVSLGVKEGARPTCAQLIVAQLVHKAGVDGDLTAIREILDRLLGKPVQHNQHVTATLSYQDFLLSIVDEREKKELGIIDVSPEPESVLPPARTRKKLPAPAPTTKKDPNDPMSDLL